MGSARWFDTHVHLERYAPAARRSLVRRAREASVGGLLAVSTSVESSRRTITLESVWKAVGVHPMKAGEVPASAWQEIEKLAQAPEVVAIGEAGFDGQGPPFDRQEPSFRRQCDLARKLGLALVLHVDGAWEAFVGAADALDGLRVVRHYFTGDGQQAAWHAARGHWLSFGRPLLRERRLRDIAASYRAELLLVETDVYPLPGRTTEPRDVVEVGETLALVRGWSAEECAERLWLNSCRALGIATRPEA